MCYVCCGFDLPQEVNAATRLLAARANPADAIHYLESLGFSGLKMVGDREDRIMFKFQRYDPKVLVQNFGAPKEGITSDSIRYVVKGFGTLAIWPKQSKVSLLNTGRKSKTPPAEDAPPVPKDPIKTGNENDDVGVPLVPVPQELHDLYEATQGSKVKRIKFMGKLWYYLNTHKFGGRLELPGLMFMKDQGIKMRVRGVWSAQKRVLAIAPQVFNARLRFFIEVFLHEMCHQATWELSNMSEAEKADNARHKGHGKVWSKWMRKVGLNPLRYDPNENTVYMNPKQLEEYMGRQDAMRQAQKEAEAKMLQPATLKLGESVIVRRHDGLRKGVLVCQAVKAGNKWAVIPQDLIDREAMRPDFTIWIQSPSTLYKDRNGEDQRFDPVFQYLSRRVIQHYEGKAVKRRQRRALNDLF